ncbi:MAG: hypothetical protein PVH29_04325 [Candidatus Zixiibacteriota bacterium]
MKTAIAVASAFILCLTVACGAKKTNGEKGPEPAGETAPGETAEDAGESAANTGSELNITLVLTREQVKDVERRREENAAAGTDEVTLEFTPEQIDAITRLCPACKATSVTAPADRFAGRTVLLYLDDAGGITAAPKRYRPR